MPFLNTRSTTGKLAVADDRPRCHRRRLRSATGKMLAVLAVASGLLAFAGPTWADPVEATPLASAASVSFFRYTVPRSGDRIFNHRIDLKPGAIVNPSRVMVFVTPRTDLSQDMNGIPSADTNALGLAVGRVGNDFIEIDFRRVDYIESISPALILDVLIIQF